VNKVWLFLDVKYIEITFLIYKLSPFSLHGMNYVCRYALSYAFKVPVFLLHCFEHKVKDVMKWIRAHMQCIFSLLHSSKWQPYKIKCVMQYWIRYV
jgi:hypothetical protein